MLKNFLTDQLTLAVAIGSQPNFLSRAQCLPNGFELGCFVSALCRASAVKAFRSQKYRRPALPCRHNILWFEEIKQMTLRGEDISVARTNGGANVLHLARFLGDDDLIRQDGHFRTKR